MGYTKAPLWLDMNKMTYVTHTYDGPTSNNLVDCNGGPLSMGRYFFFAKAHKKRISSIYTSKTNGPPKGKLGAPKFAELKASDATDQSTMGYKITRKEGETAHAH